METILVIFEIIALAAFVALCIVLVGAVRRGLVLLDKTTQSLDEVVHVVKDIDRRVMPVIETLNTTLKQTGDTVEQIDRELENVSAIIGHFKAVAERVDTLEQRIQSKVERPLLQAATFVSGISKAVVAFSDTFGRKR